MISKNQSSKLGSGHAAAAARFEDFEEHLSLKLLFDFERSPNKSGITRQIKLRPQIFRQITRCQIFSKLYIAET